MRDKKPFKNEAEFIAWILQQAGRSAPRRAPSLTKGRATGLTLGIGDDAAMLQVPPGRELILTTDLSIEGVHFTTSLHPPESAGHRALARSLSDIAAMGAAPRYALISLAISPSLGREWLEGFFRGFLALARRFQVALIGGDTSVVEGPCTIDAIVAGEVSRGRALRRTGAHPGDLIYVSGRLGMSALGLRTLQKQAISGQQQTKSPKQTLRAIQAERAEVTRRGDRAERVGRADQEERAESAGQAHRVNRAALVAHLFPEPQCALSQFLSNHRLPTAMMDLSDGLSIDLRRLCEASGVGATVFANRLPAPPVADRDDALALALDGGEDYQLLFTVPKSRLSKLPSHFGRTTIHCIGEIQGTRALTLLASDGSLQPLEPRGYDHFARR